jgi:hypothetical protein
MRTLVRICGVILGLAVGGTVGGFVGWSLGDLGGLSDQENIWFLFFVAGSAIGLAVAIAIILRRAALGWSFSIIVGTASGIAAATVFILLASWRGRP